MASTNEHDVASTSAESSKKNEGSHEIFPGYTSVSDFSQQMLRTVLQATKASNDLPTGDDYDFYSTYNSVRNILDMEARRLLHLLQDVMRHQNVKGTITGSDHALELDEQFDVIIDANDQILERVGTWVDEATGVKKNEQKLVVSAVSRPNPAVTSWNKRSMGSDSPSMPVQLLTARNIQRPQLSFRDKIDNSNNPFVPVIAFKPHALKSLQDSLQLPAAVTLEDTESPDFVYPHPYQYELDEWQPSPQQLERVTPQEVVPITSPPKFIDTASDLAELCDLLKTEKELAVDLEHHSYRTFQGFVCLMQISTRRSDFVIDTLALRSDMSILNEVLTNPSIVKVFHGAESDIEWLQRDFGLYVVNMFDTGQAARVLNLARYSLAHLLQVYCQVEADKQFQLSDWRIRPLPEKMVRYAQEDTHYLLYIYDRMRMELMDRGNERKNLLQAVYQRSKELCLRVYRKKRLTADSHLDLYMKSKKVFNTQQLHALKCIYAWRDRLAREEDESTQYVLPNHMLLQMAEILPRERQGVLACCNPIPPLVRQCQHEIHNLIMEARESTLMQVEEKTHVLEPSSAQHPHYITPLYTCPHDLSKQSSAPDQPNTDTADPIPRKGSSLFRKEISIVVKEKPILSALVPLNTSGPGHRATRLAGQIRRTFGDPFFKFLPQDREVQNSNIIKQRNVQGDMTWRLKKKTGVAGHKRRSNVDLNTFAPEFVPPAKSKRQEATPQSETTAAPQNSEASTSTATTTVATATSGKRTSQPVTVKAVEVAAEEADVSLRQMMKKKKKEKKAKRKASAASSPVKSPVVTVPSPTPDTTEGKSKKKKEKADDSLVAGPAVASEDVDAGEKEKKKKKKKKKMVEAVKEEDITPFDYSAADKSTLTGQGKKTVYPQVYNPNFHGGPNRHSKGKKNRSGAKQRKSMTFK